VSRFKGGAEGEREAGGDGEGPQARLVDEMRMRWPQRRRREENDATCHRKKGSEGAFVLNETSKVQVWHACSSTVWQLTGLYKR
jgi:hypothetical protein